MYTMLEQAPKAKETKLMLMLMGGYKTTRRNFYKKNYMERCEDVNFYEKRADSQDFIVDCLISGKSYAVDASDFTAAERRRLIRQAGEYGYFVLGVQLWKGVPPEELPEEVPTRKEGFDGLYLIFRKGSVVHTEALS